MNRRQFRSFAFVLLLATFSVGCSFFAPRKPSVVILSPALGSQFNEGETVPVQVVATDASGIARVELLVDGAIVHSDAPANPLQSYSVTETWQARGGTHTISVRAVNTSGTASDPATVQVAVTGTGAPAAAPTALASALTPTPPSTTQLGGSCSDDSAFVADVTIPDGTVLAARRSFDKVWRVRNAGTCSWGQGYQLVLVSGTVLSGPTAVNIPAAAPGTNADLAVTVAAPERAGTFTSMWRLRNPAGALFGATLTVTIRVTLATTGSSCSGTPNIESFSASPATISSGQNATLTWGLVSNANTAEIDNGIGGIATPGSAIVHPSTTTTYTLTAFCGTTTTTRQVTVQVAPTPTASPSPIPPTATPMPPTAAPSPTATTSSLSLVRCFTSGESGEAIKEGNTRFSSPLAEFGDDNANNSHRTFLTFAIQDLAGRTIDSASLSISAFATQGNPFGLGPVIVETVSYTPPVKGSDYDLSGSNLLNITSGLTGQYDVKNSLSSAISTREPRYQLRFRFSSETNGNGVADLANFTHTIDVCLNITMH